MEQDNDIPTLPADTQAILNQFLADKVEVEKSQDLFKQENWQLSQFWYDEETQKAFGKMIKKLIKHFDDDISISLMSCPSLYETISSIADNVKIFEFDEKFSKYGKAFVHYDYNLGDDGEYLKDFHGCFDLIILDPPFLSEECLKKSLMIVNRLKKEKSLIVLNTGSIQRDLAKQHGLNESKFKPQHKNNLANDFSTFSNFDIDDFLSST